MFVIAVLIQTDCESVLPAEVSAIVLFEAAVMVGEPERVPPDEGQELAVVVAKPVKEPEAPDVTFTTIDTDTNCIVLNLSPLPGATKQITCALGVDTFQLLLFEALVVSGTLTTENPVGKVILYPA